MELDRYPLVSIGVPVFNGERGLSHCLDCLLAQDYPNLEIVISDNGSTDATPEIAQRYAKLDPRVEYHRSESNRGSRWNFNRAFELCSGEYFVWAAHDDERAPAFIRECVEQLQRNPDAVLCQAHTAVSIDGSPGTLYVARLDSFADKTTVAGRYRETLKRFPAPALYGVYRASAVRKTHIFRKVIGTDLAFVQELSIHGRFVQVPRTLFTYRVRRTWNTSDEDARAFLGIERKPWWYVPFLRLFLEHADRVRIAPIPSVVKAQLLAVLINHQIAELSTKVVLKLTGAVCPPRWKERVGWAMFRQWLANPNVGVLDRQLFFQRVCKPQLGWWR